MGDFCESKLCVGWSGNGAQLNDISIVPKFKVNAIFKCQWHTFTELNGRTEISSKWFNARNIWINSKNDFFLQTFSTFPWITNYQWFGVASLSTELKTWKLCVAFREIADFLCHYKFCSFSFTTFRAIANNEKTNERKKIVRTKT